MWNSKKSILLSQLCVVAFMIMLIFTVVSTPWLVRGFISFSRAHLCPPTFVPTHGIPGLASCQILATPLVAMLY